MKYKQFFEDVNVNLTYIIQYENYLSYYPYLPEVGFIIPQACRVVNLSQLPIFKKWIFHRITNW